jgi:tRNA(fMet)-specific endonuclease VapC
MSFLLDTDTCSAHLKRPALLAHRFIQHLGRMSIPTIVLAELHDWAHLPADPAPRLRQIGDLLTEVNVLDFDSACAEQFGRLRSLLRRQGVVVAPLDLMIGSVAIAHGLTVVTHNTAHFARIPGLPVEDWLTP